MNYIIADFDKELDKFSVIEQEVRNNYIHIVDDSIQQVLYSLPTIAGDQNEIHKKVKEAEKKAKDRVNDLILKKLYSDKDKMKISSPVVLYSMAKQFMQGNTINKINKSILFDTNSNPVFKNIPNEDEKIELKLKLYDNYNKRLLNIFAEVLRDNQKTLLLANYENEFLERIYNALISFPSPNTKWGMEQFYDILKQNTKKILSKIGSNGKIDFSLLSKKYGGIVYYSNEEKAKFVATERLDTIAPLAFRYNYLIITHAKYNTNDWVTAGSLNIEGKTFTRIIDALQYLILAVIAKKNPSKKPKSILVISCNPVGNKVTEDKIRIKDFFPEYNGPDKASLREIVEENNILLRIAYYPLYSPFVAPR